MKSIIAQNLVKTYDKGTVKALDGLSLEVEEGTVLGLLGPNGAGKTTTVRVLATLLTPDSGSATVAGIDVLKHPDEVRKVIGLSGQYAALDETLTGWDNLTMFGRLYHLNSAASKKRAEELLEKFSLTDAAKRPIRTYSGGMRRRLDLAASLIVKPKVLFLDEPTTGLDPRGRMEMWGVIDELVKGGVTLLLTTQYLEEADHLADSIAVIDILKKETDYTQGASNRAQNIATGAVAGAAGAGAPGVGAAGGLPDMAKAMNLDEENRVIQQAPPDIAPKDITLCYTEVHAFGPDCGVDACYRFLRKR